MSENSHFLLFDFRKFVDELRKDEEKEKTIKGFEEKYGSLKDKDYMDLPFYKDYLCKFKIPAGLMKRIKVPPEIAEDFDYELLLRLVIGSFSSSYSLEHDDKTDKERLLICVTSNAESVAKYLDDLWSFQVLRLFEIYFAEQMDLASLWKSSKEEKSSITAERKLRLQRFEKKKEILNRDRSDAPEREKSKNRFLELIGESA